MKKKIITVEGVEIRLLTESKSDYISLTDLTQNFEGGNGLVEKWLRNRNTVEFLGMTAKQWQEANPTLKGNIRDYATSEQLLVLANLENLNAHFIKEGLKQIERLQRLNEVAIYQMELFEGMDTFKQLKK